MIFMSAPAETDRYEEAIFSFKIKKVTRKSYFLALLDKCARKEIAFV